ncbi:MAG: CDP-diacylglycerol--glycerol-3-phosphate 3-phosphatidyltransferase [Candidatus Omnitrophica bacterium]|nr:CDP-diacylglycerol--glycerol-3-phosphate 3-phosphatidyltransferase [Candidatus Omnitrophota bacterium]MCM8793875.1 CDP-diacylglycerol--glycerol-3-phosphate 3-phosphatidyltransferase [Candidatus Omnitrophota bacterium]
MNLANRLSFFRIVLIPLFIALMLYYTPQRDYLRSFAAFIFILSVISDFLDGYIARRSGQITRMGTLLDPIADKLLINTSFILLFIRKGLSASFTVPLWLPLVVLSRDLLLVIGSLLIYLTQGKLEIKPTLLGKLSTFFQTLTIIFIILHFSLVPIFWYITGFFTIASGLNYLWKGSKWVSPESSE